MKEEREGRTSEEASHARMMQYEPMSMEMKCGADGGLKEQPWKLARRGEGLKIWHFREIKQIFAFSPVLERE